MSAPPQSDVDADDPTVGERRRSGQRRRKHRSWARRKHLGLITVGAALVILVAGVLIVVATWDRGRVPLSRQTAGVATGAATPPPATAATTAPSVSAAPGTITVRGTITAIGDSRWTVAGDTGITYTVVVTPTTTISRGREFSSFEVGQSLTVKGTLDSGTITAASVTGSGR